MLDTIFAWLMSCKERGYIPDFIFRWILRQLAGSIAKRLRCGGDVEKQQLYKMRFVKKLKDSATTVVPEKANEQHYEVPTEFHQLYMGKYLKYSCGLWNRNIRTMDESEVSMMELSCQRAGLPTDGSPFTVLDIGCGWGSLTLFLADRYPAAQITSVSNSRTQKQYIDAEAKRRGVADRVNVNTCDIAVYSPGTQFDYIMSVEMFEHVRNYENLFGNVASWLKPGGKLFVHILGNRKYTYAFDSKGKDWMSDFFFSGGTMPSEDLFLFFLPNTLRVKEIWRINGTQYKKTLDAWLARLDKPAVTKQALKIFDEQHKQFPSSTQPGWLALARWRMFFLMSAEVFGFQNGSQWMCFHYLFEKRASE
eukprot:TRINITY_DN75092_c0_g1_i1.p1 TRINITY_DN75092_c0_g1~~TRINITY_DN75092_c0_g1_i1.p1  ORF type:complete len:364 (-),score=43.91 TRINITY_DN75092_c0_g1_i1:76-1167(-)